MYGTSLAGCYLPSYCVRHVGGGREEGGRREMSQIYDLLAAIVSCPATRYLIQFFVPHKAAQSVYIVYVQPIPINIFIKTCQ